ncbi:hypothetical protein GCM10018785_47130 [Streptomyces longispororuber]|uniref:DUF6571 domain-containing protein n=1 Tax=Streptomyces longispororuber TaxID=68230 RepID=A0A918ZXS1_9ACTN|nr:DUF6571 family protein [Streptomyces longispororuber]GHE73588.1 hypothetical protein GCM10018785_47130 [Streptomyces longispororuber]
MLTVEELLGLRLGKLASALDDWEAMTRRLDELAGGRGGGDSAALLRRKAELADWKGVNATVGKAFVVKTAAEFDDAVTSATSVTAILRDALKAFARHKREMAELADSAAKRNIRITPAGGAEARSPRGAAEDGGPTQADLIAVMRDATRVLREADETDQVAERALRALARGEHDFSDLRVTGLGHAKDLQGKADAAHWAKEIAKGGAGQWSDEKLERFNDTLARYQDTPAFAAALATGLGAEGTLRFWRDLADPAGTLGTVGPGRADLLGRVQENLGLTLAAATRVDSPGMDAWKRHLIEAGDDRLPAAPGIGSGAAPYGFDVMSNLMRKGKYDTEFLQNYGSRLLEFEKGLSPFTSRGSTHLLNRLPDETSADPVSGFLESLGHNPEASLRFLHTGPESETNWDYLVSHEDGSRNAWFSTLSDLGGTGRDQYETSLGHALESAATRTPYDADTPPKPHSEASASFVHRLVDYYGSNPEVLDDSKLRGSLGNITAEYMRDFQDGMNGQREITTSGSNADLGALSPSARIDFLAAVGKDPTAYGAILNAQQSITTELVNETLQDRSLPKGLSTADVNNMVAPGSQIAGIMAEARTQAVYEDRLAQDDEFNEGLRTADKWAGRVIDLGANRFPGVGDALSWIAEDARETVVERYTRDSSDVAEKERLEFLRDQLQSSGGAAYEAARSAALNAGYSESAAEKIANAAEENSRLHYGLGGYMKGGG